jgi:signal transduction histidine kinase
VFGQAQPDQTLTPSHNCVSPKRMVFRSGEGQCRLMRKYARILVSYFSSVPLWVKIAGIQIFPIVLISLTVLYSTKNTLDTLAESVNPEVLSDLYTNVILNSSFTIGIAVAAATAFALLLSIFLVRPFRQVLSAIQQVEMGDFSARVSVWSQDEIGQMLKAFNNMIVELQSTQSALIHRNWQLASVNELAESVSVGQGTDAVIEFALKKVIGIMAADIGAIYLLSPDGEEFALKAVEGTISPDVLDVLENSPSGRNMIRSVVQSGHALVIQDTHTYPVPSGDDFSFILQDGFQTWACSPLKVEGDVIGVYQLGRYKNKPPVHFDNALLEVVGNVVGVSLSNAQLLRDLRIKEAELRRALHRAVEVQEDERKRLARELHDEIGQALTSILIQLKTVQDEKDVNEIINRIDNLRQLTSETIEELRRLAMDLRPTALDNLGIAAALRWHTRQCAERAGVDIHFSEPDYFERLPSHIELILYRVAQEGLNNAIRHGKASRIELGLEIDETTVRLTISDNGKGFQKNERYSGLGLVGIRERVELLEGHFTLDSSPGTGTCLLIEIPVPVKETPL